MSLRNELQKIQSPGDQGSAQKPDHAVPSVKRASFPHQSLETRNFIGRALGSSTTCSPGWLHGLQKWFAFNLSSWDPAWQIFASLSTRSLPPRIL